MNTPLIQLTNLTLAYGQRVVFKQLNLSISEGSWTGILGSSGAGKSSLLRLLAGLTNANQMTSGFISPLVDQIAYMAQTDLLLPWLTVLDNALLAHKLHPSQKKQREKALSLLAAVGLEKAVHLYPHELSGGMRQRAALTRTLMSDKPIILMDEPFSAVDTITRYRLQNLSLDLLKNKTVIFITHDPLEALRLADDIYLMQDKPATLKQVLHLNTPKPRTLNNIDMLNLQSTLLLAMNEDNVC
ncbi:MAG: ABC transporter ATP-binding protein [Gammaproteobacteria bacterium]